jgi:transposase
MWTAQNRARYDRSKLRYPSDLTDEEWELVEPLIAPGKPGGGKCSVIMREIVNGLMYVLSTGCQRTCRRRARSMTISICGPTTAHWIASIMRSISSVVSKTSVKRAQPPPSLLVDTLGLLLHAIVHPADIQDRDGGVFVLSTVFGMFPFLQKLFADGGYQGPRFANAVVKILPSLDIEIVKRPDAVVGFKIVPKRWIVALPGSACQGLGVPQSQGARLLAPRFHSPAIHAPRPP